MHIVQDGHDIETHLLSEPSETPEAAALIAAFEATLQGEPRSVITVLPETDVALMRFVMDARGDVLFASELLETEAMVHCTYSHKDAYLWSTWNQRFQNRT